jgi:hypothetical protein
MSFDRMALKMNDIIQNCLSSAMVILVFAFNLAIQAVVTLRQKRVASIPNKTNLAERFRRTSQCLFVFGIIFMLVAFLFLSYRGLAGYWIPGGITLFALAGTLVVWKKKLTTKNQKKFGQRILITSRVLIGVALAVFFAGLSLWLWMIHIPIVAIIITGIVFIVWLALWFWATYK